LLAQLKHVGERVPSQQSKPDGGGGGVVVFAVTAIENDRVAGAHPPPLAKSVMLSVPFRDALYCTDRDDVPDDGLIALPRDEVSVHEVAPAMETVSVALLPSFTVAGPFSDAVVAGFTLTTVTASLPAPQALLARPA
jgi:hypothetical protein